METEVLKVNPWLWLINTLIRNFTSLLRSTNWKSSQSNTAETWISPSHPAVLYGRQAAPCPACTSWWRPAQESAVWGFLWCTWWWRWAGPDPPCRGSGKRIQKERAKGLFGGKWSRRRACVCVSSPLYSFSVSSLHQIHHLLPAFLLMVAMAR